MKRTLRLLAVTAPLLLASLAQAKDLPNFDAYGGARPVPAPRVAGRAMPPAVAASIDPMRGVPTFLWITRPSQGGPAPFASMTFGDAAQRHVGAHAARYGLSQAALAAAEIVGVHEQRGGTAIVVLRQRVAGVPLFRSDMKLLLDARRELVAIGGHLHAAAGAPPKGKGFALGPEEAVARALVDLHAIPVKAGNLRDRKQPRGEYRSFDLQPSAATAALGLALEIPARARKVYFPMPGGLVPAYFLEVVTRAKTTDHDAHAYVIAADDGRVLYRENLVHAASFDYRVWADPAGDKRPGDGPLADFSPHPTGAPGGGYPAAAASTLVSMDGFNTNPNATFDPWLPAGATETSGNNVDAYTDDGAPNGFSANDVRASVTSAGVFDHTYDLGLGAQVSVAQKMAAVTQIFYVTNWLHDWWYDAGFDEAAGNAQLSNYGRGGVEGDPVRAEAQDGAPGSRNNANMSAMADGQSPQMQMYVWDGVATSSLTVQPLNQSLPIGAAAFGPTAFNTTQTVALVGDSSGTTTDACQAITSNVAGQIALVDRGNCTFKLKAVNAQSAGAVGMILVDNVAGATPPAMPNGNPTLTTISIPVVSITLADGAAILAALANGPVTATLAAQPAFDLDGTIDNTVVAHEWGHYLHLRLVQCGSALCGAESEGWADFVALHMAVRQGDDLDGAFALSQYATGSFQNDPAYFGIRRYPYSIDFAKNALTFKHIAQGTALPVGVPGALSGAPSNNAEVHNAGEIWATMLFEAYVALLKQTEGPSPPYDFTEARRRMGDYVVAGMQLAPVDPTFLEQRDGILAAAYAADPADMAVIASAFARRGAGTCAVSPAKTSTTFQGVVETFTTAPQAAIVSATIDDLVASCDQDGYLDALETGRVTVQVANTGVAQMTTASVTITSTTPGVTFLGAPTLALGTLDPFATATVTVDVQIDPAATQKQTLDLTVTLDAPEACTTSSQLTIAPLANADEVLASSATDDVEPKASAWSPQGPIAAEVWSIEEPTPADHAWVGIDYPSPSDTQLVSPPLDVSANGNLVLTFTHRYQFEFTQSTYWDGGVIELSTDGGMNWFDAATLGSPSYDGMLGDPQNQAQNVLKGRQGYGNQNPSWPGTDVETIDLGSSLAGQTVLVRFRIGTDDAAGGAGWQIDDIAFAGITNTPFATVVDDAAGCVTPVADAGPDQTVTTGDLVTLDASASSDADTAALTFGWTEATGLWPLLPDPTSAVTTFTAPFVDAPATITYMVTVSDGFTFSNDTVDITVLPATASASTTTVASTTGAGGGATTGAGGAGGAGGVEQFELRDVGGCGCVVAGGARDDGEGSLAGAAMAAAIAAAMRRRRAKV